MNIPDEALKRLSQHVQSPSGAATLRAAAKQFAQLALAEEPDPQLWAVQNTSAGERLMLLRAGRLVLIEIAQHATEFAFAAEIMPLDPLRISASVTVEPGQLNEDQRVGTKTHWVFSGDLDIKIDGFVVHSQDNADAPATPDRAESLARRLAAAIGST
jgi:hypothetical protein